MDLKKLTEPFPAADIEWRVGQSGKSAKGYWCKVLAYLTARAVQERLDDVFGPFGWQATYVRHDGGWICNLACWDPEKEQWIHKSDGAEDTQIESFKGGLSGALKRAAVHWGIGRYLYKLEEEWAETSEQRQEGWHYAKTREGGTFYWIPPQLPPWALPKGTPVPSTKGPPPEPRPNPVERAQKSLGLSKDASTPKQRNMIWALTGKLGITKDQFAEMIKRRFGAESSTNLTKAEASQVIEGLKDKLEKSDKEAEEVQKAIDEEGKKLDKQMQEFSFDTTSALHPEGVPQHREELWPEETKMEPKKKNTARQLREEASGLIASLKVKGVDISSVFESDQETKKALESWTKPQIESLVEALKDLNKEPIVK